MATRPDCTTAQESPEEGDPRQREVDIVCGERADACTRRSCYTTRKLAFVARSLQAMGRADSSERQAAPGAPLASGHPGDYQSARRKNSTAAGTTSPRSRAAHPSQHTGPPSARRRAGNGCTCLAQEGIASGTRLIRVHIAEAVRSRLARSCSEAAGEPVLAFKFDVRRSESSSRHRPRRRTSDRGRTGNVPWHGGRERHGSRWGHGAPDALYLVYLLTASLSLFFIILYAYLFSIDMSQDRGLAFLIIYLVYIGWIFCGARTHFPALRAPIFFFLTVNQKLPLIRKGNLSKIHKRRTVICEYFEKTSIS